MIILDATTKKLQVVLDGAAATTELPVMASFAEMTTTTYLPVESDTITTGATAVDVVAAPAASTQRQVKLLTIPNVDTAVRTVTVRYNNNGTIRKLFVATLAVGDCLVYTDGEGFRVLDATGAVKAAAVRSTNDRLRPLHYTLDGGGSVITTGEVAGIISVPYSGRIQSVTLFEASVPVITGGSIVIDIWKDSYTNYPPTVADTITASAKPTLTTAVKSVDATLSGWNVVLTAGDALRLSVSSASLVKRVELVLSVLTD